MSINPSSFSITDYLPVQEMDSLIALLTILRYNPSLKSIDLSRPIPQYQHSNWMDDVAIHIAQMLEVINE